MTKRSFVTHDWAVHRAQILDLFTRVRAIAQLVEPDQPAPADPPSTLTATQRLDAARTSMLDSAFRIMVFGDFSSGKSTLINALVGHDVLPMRANPTTAFTTEIRWAEAWSAELTEVDPQNGYQWTRAVTIEDFQGEVTLRFEDEDSPAVSPYVCGVVQGPVEILRDHVQFIDSAGMNEDPVRESVTLSYLPKADAVIYVTMAKAAFKQHDREHYLKMLRAYGHRDIFYVVNQFDEIRRAEDRVTVEIRCRGIARADAGGREPRIFFTSALDALEARTEEPDEEKLHRSGVPQLEAAIRDFLHRGRAMIKLQRPAEVIRQEILRLRHLIRLRRELLSRDSAELLSTFDNQTQRRREIESMVQQIELSLATWLERTEMLLLQRTELFLRARVAEVPLWAKQAPRVSAVKNKETVAEQLSAYLESRLSQAMQEFSVSTEGIRGLLEEREAVLQKDLLPLIKEYAGQMEQLERALTGTTHTVDEAVLRSWLTELTMYAALHPDEGSTAMSATGLVGGLVLTGGAAASGLAAVVGTASIGAVALAAAPLVLAAIAVPLAIRHIGRGRARKATAQTFASELQEDAHDIAGRYSRELASRLGSRTSLLSSELKGKFDEMIKEAEAAVVLFRSNQDDLLETQRRLDEWDKSLNDIDHEVSDIVRRVLELTP
jgi:GTPase Era involved in 16S rRNA processing